MWRLAGRFVVSTSWPDPVSLPLRWIVTGPLTCSFAPLLSVTLLKQYVPFASFTVPLFTTRFPLLYVNVPPLIPVLPLSGEHTATAGTDSAVDSECCVTVPLTVPEIDAVVPAVTFPLTLAPLATDTEPCVEIALPPAPEPVSVTPDTESEPTRPDDENAVVPSVSAWSKYFDRLLAVIESAAFATENIRWTLVAAP